MVVLPSSIGPVHFGLPLGLYALGGLIALLILYLIRPRPKKMELPSLMFFMRLSGKSVMQSFFRTIMRDMLFLIQLIAAIALLLMPAQPFTNTSINLAAEHVVFVIDASASSQVRQEGGTRLENSIEQAKTMVGKTNTIVLAKGTPQVIAQDVNAQEAKTALGTIVATDTGSRIGEAMLVAGQALQGDGRIVVFSDFDNTDGVEAPTARTALQSRGQHVTLINTAAGKVDNIGFIDLAAGEDASVAYIRNYGGNDRKITLHIGDNAQEITLPASSILPVRFNTPSGTTTLRLDTNDAFPPDDTAILSAPDEKKIRVLLITNAQSKFLYSALTSSPLVDVAISEPPIISKEQYDVYILDHIKPTEVLPGTYQTLLDAARGGAGVVINAQDMMASINFGSLLPIAITGDGKDANVRVDQETALTKNFDFGNVKTYIKAEPLPGTISLASAGDNSTIIALRSEGNGLVAYYGLLETGSEFKLTPDYPIFWQALMRAMAQRANIQDLNLKAGDSITVDEKTTVEAPDGKQLIGPIINFEHAGAYKVGDRNVGVSYLNARESSLIYHPEIGKEEDTGSGATLTEERQFDWGPLLLAIGAGALLVELIFLKVRGDV